MNAGFAPQQSGPVAEQESGPRVDIAIPIHDQLHVVRPCLESILRWTSPGVARVTLVADACDDRTTDYLEEWVPRYSGARIVPNQRNLGFVRSCNRALRSASADLVVLLNSDTCVTPRWIEKLLACIDSDPRIGVVSPLSNFAPHMRVPMLPGTDYLEMAERVEDLWHGEYPDVTTPEGFCFAITRGCLAVVGLFDEAYDQGYGEESDFALRACYHGFRTVCATNVYVYHRGRATFGTERRDSLYRSSRQVFNHRWQNKYPLEVEEFRRRDPIGVVRRRIETDSGKLQPAFVRSRDRAEPTTGLAPLRRRRSVTRRHPQALHLLFVLPTLNPYGGVISIVNHVNDLIEAGHRVTLLSMSRIPNDVLFPKTEPVFLPADADLCDLIPGEYDVLVATSWETVRYVRDAAAQLPLALPLYYVQDIEADFFGDRDAEKRNLALATYAMIPHRVVKTPYLERRLSEMGYAAHRIPPGMNLDLFYRRSVPHDPALTVLGMARPGAPGDIRGFEVLRQVFVALRAERPDFRLAVFGSDELPDDFPRDVNYGRLGRDQIPAAYSAADVFVETSRIHGFGRCGVEAMACRVACVLSASGGISLYARDGENALVVPAADPDAVVRAVVRLAEDQSLRERISRAGADTARGYGSAESTAALLALVRRLRTEAGEPAAGVRSTSCTAEATAGKSYP